MTGKKIDAKKSSYRKPIRTFEKSGSVDPKASYSVSLGNVVKTDKQDIKTMIDRGRYFSMFAPRQSGKTTFLEEVCGQLHKNPIYVAVFLCFQDFKNLDKSAFYSSIERELYKQLLNRLKEVRCEKIETVDRFLKEHHLTPDNKGKCIKIGQLEEWNGGKNKKSAPHLLTNLLYFSDSPISICPIYLEDL